MHEHQCDDVVIVGGGILGLSTAYQLLRERPRLSLTLLEKEPSIAVHQTGRNSGVIHSGVYYPPGSLKARTTERGREQLLSFCRAHAIPHELCGKVIVASKGEELPGLRRLHERAEANRIPNELIDRHRLRELEPAVEGVAALHVPSAGIVDFRAVCMVLTRLISEAGGRIAVGSRVDAIAAEYGGVRVETSDGVLRSRVLVNCAGLHSDRVAKLAGVQDDHVRIVPFRGEYYELAPQSRSLVRNLVYPVPDPAFPFLGVHLTRMIDGNIHAGPNAVLALAREGYDWSTISLGDTWDALGYAGFRRLARRHARAGLEEMHRSLSKRAFVKALRRLVPELRPEDLVPSQAGVRAQALRADGTLVDDFAFAESPHAVHVVNAPSPAATASLEIGRIVAERAAANLVTQ